MGQYYKYKWYGHLSNQENRCHGKECRQEEQDSSICWPRLTGVACWSGTKWPSITMNAVAAGKGRGLKTTYSVTASCRKTGKTRYPVQDPRKRITSSWTSCWKSWNDFPVIITSRPLYGNILFFFCEWTDNLSSTTLKGVIRKKNLEFFSLELPVSANF